MEIVDFEQLYYLKMKFHLLLDVTIITKLDSTYNKSLAQLSTFMHIHIKKNFNYF